MLHDVVCVLKRHRCLKPASYTLSLRSQAENDRARREQERRKVPFEIMSNIYIQEPPTNGKVLLTTTSGEIDIELWSKEAPKACRNFVQLCLEGYYDGTIFHRIVKGFCVQGGDPTGTGMGKSTSKKKLPQIANMFKQSHYKINRL
ncbi:PREDICTED: peptidyl-prolyl cis-trans isomerase CWC27 homolog [Acropora digitifera]|uniref:peptidyl-prolyl cis-trans isomerase CWC27 homolog n=1 Tax=Acropora digitifera TaxID=70779 RepID=UPI00077A79D5|nr:PREDICTED: peptidyl-prolyl cis-trans isomerase CWC27 homolog [Acropora digitifera]